MLLFSRSQKHRKDHSLGLEGIAPEDSATTFAFLAREPRAWNSKNNNFELATVR